MSSYTSEQVIALAPDASSAKSGKDLANRRKWVSAGKNGAVAIWGECQGSGSTPYQTQVDLSTPAFKCSCPSRKFPCKHGLGLLLLFAQDEASFNESDLPPWVASWMESRQERAEKQTQKAAAAKETPVDPAAQAKRIAQREERIKNGLDELERWLCDLVRRGLANSDLGYSTWDSIAARLVDSQAPGLARLLRGMASVPSITNKIGKGTWQEKLMERIGLIYLAIQGYRNLETLSPEEQADLRTLIGWTTPQEEIMALPGIVDKWIVIGQYTSEEDNLLVHRTWLYGQQTGKPALILQARHPSQPGSFSTYIPGSAYLTECSFYPSNYPLRALMKDASVTPASVPDLSLMATLTEMNERYADALCSYPWLERFPVVINNVKPVRQANNSWHIIDSGNNTIPLATSFANPWRMVSIGGGHAVTITGEWNGETLMPFGVFSEGHYITLL